MTVVDGRWWLNCKVDGGDALLYNWQDDAGLTSNMAAENEGVVGRLYRLGVADAGGEFPDYLLAQARGEVEIPRWNPLAPSESGGREAKDAAELPRGPQGRIE